MGKITSVERGGYSKNYRDKEKLYGFALWLRDAELNQNAKNIAGLMLCQAEVNKAIKAQAKVAKPRKKPVKVYTGNTALFSVHKAAEGGISFKDAKEQLEAAGVEHVHRGYSPYVGQYGITVPVKYKAKASKVLFG